MDTPRKRAGKRNQPKLWDWDSFLVHMRKAHIENTLRDLSHDEREAARRLQMPLKMLRRWMRELGIEACTEVPE